MFTSFEINLIKRERYISALCVESENFVWYCQNEYNGNTIKILTHTGIIKINIFIKKIFNKLIFGLILKLVGTLKGSKITSDALCLCLIRKNK